MKDINEEYKRLLKAEVPPIKLGNKNKSGKCGMCGINVQKLYPQKVGQVDFMICERLSISISYSAYLLFFLLTTLTLPNSSVSFLLYDLIPIAVP